MKQSIKLLLIGILSLLLVSCSNGEGETKTEQEPIPRLDKNLTKELEPKERREDQQENHLEGEGLEKEQKVSLEDFPPEEIEYASVWMELGMNQEIEKLHVAFIEEGEPLHSGIESSANYPEDVIQLTGTRLVDGSVTYSQNEDGTINVYHVPLRWEETTPKDFDEEAMKIYTESIVENTELVEIDIEDEKEEAMIALIEKIETN